MNDLLKDIDASIKAFGGGLPTNPSLITAAGAQSLANYRELLSKAAADIRVKDERISQLTEKSHACATAIRVLGEGDKKTVLIICEARLFEVGYPNGKTVKSGDSLTIKIDGMQIVDVIERISSGNVGIFHKSIDNEVAEVSVGGSSRIVYVAEGLVGMEEGDRVLLDNSSMVILQNLGNDDSRYAVTESPNVKWDDICGQTKAKVAFDEALTGPIRNPRLFKAYRKKKVKGILLTGPGGCGKTMLGQAVATLMATMNAAKGVKEGGFFYIKGAEILTKFVGDPETSIRSIFQRARKFSKRTGITAVIFFDELDAIGKKRGTGVSSDVNDTIVTTLLAEMSGLHADDILVIGATNRPDILDPALTRDGRFDYKIEVERPQKEFGREIALKNLATSLVDAASFGDEAAGKAADLIVEEMYSDKYPLYEVFREKENKKETSLFCLRHLVSGAMLAGIVEKAKSAAMERDDAAFKALEAKGDKAAIEAWNPSGINREDILAAVKRAHIENHRVNHNDELGDFTHDFKDEVCGITKLRQVSN